MATKKVKKVVKQSVKPENPIKHLKKDTKKNST